MAKVFTVHLFSNTIERGQSVVTKNPSDNPLSCFSTELSNEIVCSDEYEVAITEISFHNSFYNLVGQAKIIILDKSGSVAIETHCPAGHYTRERLAKTLNEIIHRKVQPLGENVRAPKLVYDEWTQIYNQYNDDSSLIAYFDNSLRSLLGTNISGDLCKYNPYGQSSDICNDIIQARLHNKDIKDKSNDLEIVDYSLHGDISRGVSSILVYCDIIRHGYVGDKLVPLLKAVHVDTDEPFGKPVYREYLNPEYKPLLSKSFTHINIALHDDAGDRIPFRFGRVRLTLQFRPVRDGYS